MTLPRRRSLLWQFGVGVVTLQVLVLAALGGYAYLELKQFHGEQKLQELDRLTGMLADRYRLALSAMSDESELNRMARQDGALTGARITIVLPDGRVVADSHHDPGAMDNHRFRPEVAAALGSGLGTRQRYSDTLGLDMLYLARPLGDETVPAAIIRSALPMTEVNAELTGLLRTLGSAALVSLLLTSAILYFVSRRTNTTILRLSDSAARFASGDLDHRMDVPRSTELARISEALNSMARQLSGQMEALRVQRNEQQAIVQSMSNGVLALDRQQRILSLNRAAERFRVVYGTAARGRLLQEVVRVPPLNRFVEESMDGTGGRSGEVAVGDRRPRRIQVLSETLTDARDQPAGVLIILEDVTELRRLESIRSDFAANVSHELRTPITNIKGYVETLIDSDPADRQQTERFLQVIKQNGDRLAAIVDDILALTRLEEAQARETLEKSPVPLRPVLQSVATQFEAAAADKHITLAWAAPADLQVAGHRQLLEQAVGNLVANAINYGPGETTVRLSASRLDSGEVELAVADEGPGIAAEHLPRLFERFYRVDKARSRELGGTGLGLAIVKHVALAHRGRVGVESEVGRGSRFRVVLPALG